MALIEWLKALLTPSKTCEWGYGYPKSSPKNCQYGAAVRTRIGEGEWHYYCKTHSYWPTQDRSEWYLDCCTVERKQEGEWQPWNDFDVIAPIDERRYNSDGSVNKARFG